MKKTILLLTGLLLATVAAALTLSTGLSRIESDLKTPERIALLATNLMESERSPFARIVTDSVVSQFLNSPILRGHFLKRLPLGILNQEDDSEPPFTLIFPHTARGQAAGLAVTPSLFLFNSSGSNASGTILFRKQDGSAMTVSSNLGTDSSFEFSLRPGEVLRLQAGSQGNLEVGWIEVLSDIPISGTGSFITETTQGEFLSDVGIGASPRSTQTMLFVDTTEGKDTAVAVCNPNPSTDANLEIELRRLDGSLVAARQRPLAALNQQAIFVSELFKPSEIPEIEDFKGILVVKSPSAEISVVTLRTRGVRFTSLPAAPLVSDTSDEGTLLFARLGNGTFGGLELQTTFILMNNSAKEATATVDLFNAEGEPLALDFGSGPATQVTVDIPAGGAVELTSISSNRAGVTGWAMVSSDIPISGGATFSIFDTAAGEFVTEVGIPDSPVASEMSVFVQVQGQIDTGIALTNPVPSPVTVRLRLLENVAGNQGAAALNARSLVASSPDSLVSEKIVEMQPNAHIGLFVSQLFPEVSAIQQRNFTGSLSVEAYHSNFGELLEIPLAGITLRARGAFLTSLPAAPFSVLFGPRLELQPATDLAGSEPYFCLSLRQPIGDLKMSRATIRMNRGQFDFSQVQDADVIGQFEINEFLVLALGSTFASDVTGSSAEFFSLVTPDGESEISPLNGKVENLAGGGIRFELEPNPVIAANSNQVALPSITTLCFNESLVNLPNLGGSSIEVQEEYESVHNDNGLTFQSNRTSRLPIRDIQAGAPRITSVSPTRTPAGSEITIRGSGFSTQASANQVTIAGSTTTAGTVLEASSTSLKVKLPSDASSGDLTVQSGGLVSNAYHLNVPFGPRPTVSFASLQAGAATPFTLEVRQRGGEISLLEFELRADSGQWVTQGFSAGQKLGTMRLEAPSLADLAGGPTLLNLVVNSSNSGELILDALDPEGDDETAFIIEISNSGGASMSMTPPVVEGASQLPADFIVRLEFAEPIFRMPAESGRDFQVTATMTSQPQRAFIRENSFTSEVNLTFRTN